MTSTLHLVLKRKWWDMIASGEKTEEYREIKPYWVKRLIDWKRFQDDCKSGKAVPPVSIMNLTRQYHRKFETVTFHLGYAKDRPSMTFKCNGIRASVGGRLEWGASVGDWKFIIQLGKRVK